MYEREVPITIPTIQRLKEERKFRKTELFVRASLQEISRVSPLGADATLLYIVLLSVQHSSTKEFFGIPPDTEDAIGRGRRWWYRHAETLEQAGLIEIQRRPGSSARYRVIDPNQQIGTERRPGMLKGAASEGALIKLNRNGKNFETQTY
jgi:hypothetical protein